MKAHSKITITITTDASKIADFLVGEVLSGPAEHLAAVLAQGGYKTQIDDVVDMNVHFAAEDSDTPFTLLENSLV